MNLIRNSIYQQALRILISRKKKREKRKNTKWQGCINSESCTGAEEREELRAHTCRFEATVIFISNRTCTLLRSQCLLKILIRRHHLRKLVIRDAALWQTGNSEISELPIHHLKEGQHASHQNNQHPPPRPGPRYQPTNLLPTYPFPFTNVQHQCFCPFSSSASLQNSTPCASPSISRMVLSPSGVRSSTK